MTTARQLIFSIGLALCCNNARAVTLVYVTNASASSVSVIAPVSQIVASLMPSPIPCLSSTLASVTGNNLVKRTVTFAPFTTTQIRIAITGALASFSRITEIEAWGN